MKSGTVTDISKLEAALHTAHSTACSAEPRGALLKRGPPKARQCGVGEATDARGRKGHAMHGSSRHHIEFT